MNRRIVIALLGQEEITIKATKGCPKGEFYRLFCGLLLLTTSCMIELEQQGYEVLGFADDLVIIVRGKVDAFISD
jgi:hypothetical protein